MFESIQSFAAAVETSALADAIRFSRWSYSITNTAHVLGVALLVGAILPLDLRLLGVWGRIDRTEAVRLLFPIAAFGLCLAVAAGVLLFTVRAGDYVKATLLYWKLGTITLGAALALMFHWRAGRYVERASAGQAAFHGAASLACWLGALVMGRMIAYFPH